MKLEKKYPFMVLLALWYDSTDLYVETKGACEVEEYHKRTSTDPVGLLHKMNTGIVYR